MTAVKKSFVTVAALGLMAAFIGRDAAPPWSAEETAPAAGGGLVAPALAQAGDPPPVADAGFDRTAAVGSVVMLDGSGSIEPLKGKPLDFAWTLVSVPPGSLAALDDPAAVKPSFQADLSGDYATELVVTNNKGDSSAAAAVTISTINSAPLANAGADRLVALGDLAVLDASASSDFDGDRLSYSWSLVEVPAGSQATLDDPGGLRPRFTVDLLGDYVAELTVSDGARTSAPARVAISTELVQPGPDAGPARRAQVGRSLELDGERTTDAAGREVERSWALIVQPPGSTVKLAVGATQERALLTPDAPGDYVLQLEVVDDDALRPAEFDTVAVSTVNSAPVAAAGVDRAVAAGELVELDGAGSSDADGDPLKLRWALVSAPTGSAARLDDPGAVRPSFTADLPGTYVAQLIVADGAEAGRPDTVVITTGGARPVADAGPDLFGMNGDTVMLDGTASFDPDGDPLSFHWSLIGRPDGSSTVIADPTAARFPLLLHKPTKTGCFVAQLIVSDGQLESAPDVAVVCEGSGSLPVADAGPDQEVLPGQLVQLDGAGSFDPDGDPLSFRWALTVKPAGSSAFLSDPTVVAPSFTADLIGTYVAQLIVNDGLLDSAPDTVVAAILNRPGIADAGADRVIPLRGSVTLDGTGSSDPDGDPLTFAWSFASKPLDSTAELSGADTAAPGFVADLVGDYVVQLIVNDGIVESDPDLVTISADANPPIAEAGPDQQGIEGALVTLDGSASSDPEGRSLTYSWRFLFTPEGSTAAFSDATAVGPSFTADLAGLYIAELTVSDGAFDSQPDTVAVRAGPAMGNTPPVLDPVGNQTVALGSTLSFALTGSDFEGDDLFFRAVPLPLPDGAHLDAVVEQVGLPNAGLFAFTPSPEQVGDIVLTLSVSDGLLSDSESVIITVTETPVATAFSGRILDADAFEADGTELGVFGATVTAGGATTTSAADGSFTLSAIADDASLIALDPSAAQAAPDGSAYGGLSEAIELIAGVENVRAVPFFLMRAPAAIEVPVSTTGTTLVENSTLPGVRLEVPLGATTAAAISVSELGRDVLPASIPASILPCQVVKVLPFGATFSPAASLTLPNLDNLPAGTAVDLWGLDPATGGFRVLGQGSVDSSTAIIASDLITEATYLFAVPRGPGASATDDDNPFNKTPTVLADGNFSTSLTLPSYRWLGQPQARSFVYNSSAADPRPIVAAEVTFPAATGLPPLIEGRLEVGGIEVAGPVFMDTTVSDPRNGPGDPPLVAGDTIRQAISFDASQFATGSYPYKYTATGDFGCSKVSATSTGSVIIDNQEDSPFGAGWSLAGRQRATQLPDGRIAIREGDGTVLVFDPVVENDLPIVFPDFGDLAQFRLNGSVVAINRTPVVFGGQTVLRLTNNFGQASTAVLNEAVPLEADGLRLSFRSFFTFQMTDSRGARDFDGPGADGIAFVILNRPDIVGGTGRGIGYGGISPSVVVELDTFGPQLGNTFDPNGNHVGINLNGGLRSLAATTIPTRMNNGAVWFAWVEYNGESRTLEARVSQTPERPAAPTVSRVVDLVQVLGSTTAFMGFTSATGAATNDNDLRSWDVRIFGGDIETIAFVTPRGDFSTLVKNPTTGGLTRTLKDGRSFVFDASGRQTAEIDRNGNRTDYDYDAQGRVLTITNKPGDLVTTFTYDPANGKLASVTDPAGRVTSYVYDPLGTLLKVVNPDSSEIRYDYSLESRLTAEVSERGFVTTQNYGFAGQLTGSGFPDGASAGVQSSRSVGLANLATGQGSPGNPNPFVRPSARLATFTDGRGISTTYELNNFGTIRRQTDALGRTISLTLDNNNNPVATVSPNGAKTEAEFDDRGNLVVFRDAAGTPLERERRIDFTADFNRVSRITDPNGNPPTILTYDSQGNVIETIDPNGERMGFIYADPNCPGLVTEMVKATGLPEEGSERFAYDPASCNPVEFRDALNNTTRVTYDLAGNPIEIVDALLRATRFVYDAANRITKRIDATNQEPVPQCGTVGVACFDYDASGNLIATVDANANLTTFEYDAIGRLARQFDPLGLPKAFNYDGNGNVSRTVDRKNQTIEFEYDLANRRIVERMLPGTPDENIRRFSYDEVDNPTIIEDDHSKITFTYDILNQLKSSSTAGSPFQPEVVLEYDYDSNGNRSLMVDPRGSTTYEYDTVNRLVELTDPSNQFNQIPFRFTYDGRRRLTEVLLPNSTRIERQYDLASRISSVGHATATSNFSSFSYSYSSTGYRESLEQSRTALSVASMLSFEYDNLNQVTSATRTTLGSPAESFGYDPLGNRVRRDGQIADSVFGSGNRLLADDLFVYGYDANGNLASKTSKSTGEATIFHYDAENRLTRVDFPDLSFAEYRYDGLDRRIEKNVNGEIVRYTYDNEDIVIEFDGSSNLVAHYSHGPGIDHPLLMERDIDSSGVFELTERFYYHRDALGSVTDLTDASANSVRAYAYDTFGRIALQQGSLENPYTFTGREADLESGLYYYRARYYDPVAGRFLSEDPLGFGSGDLNPYRYVFNSSINLTDPTGQAAAIGFGAIAASLTRLIKPLTILTAAILATYPCYWTGFDYEDVVKPRFPGGPLVNKTLVFCRYFCFQPPRVKFKTLEFASQPELGERNPAVFPPVDTLISLCPPVELPGNLDDAPRRSC